MPHGRRRGNNDFDDFLNDDREQQPELPIPPELLMLLGAPPPGGIPFEGGLDVNDFGGVVPPDIGGGQSPTGGPGGSRVPPGSIPFDLGPITPGKPPAPPGSFTPPNLGPGGPGPQPGGPFQQITVADDFGGLPPGPTSIDPGITLPGGRTLPSGELSPGGIPPGPTVGPGGPGPQPGGGTIPGVRFARDPSDSDNFVEVRESFLPSQSPPPGAPPPPSTPRVPKITIGPPPPPPNGQRGPGKPGGDGPGGRGVPPGSAFDVPNIQNRPQTRGPSTDVTGGFGPPQLPPELMEILRALGLNLPGGTGHTG